MSQDLFLGGIDPVTGYHLEGFSLKSIGKAIGKVVKPVAKVLKPVTTVASAVGIPGAGLVNAALQSKVGQKVTTTVKKVEAVKKAVTPPKPPPKPVFYAPAKPLPIIATANRAGTPSKVSGVLPIRKTTAIPVTKAAPKLVPKAAAKPTVFATQAQQAGITFKQRAKKTGGTETVAVNSSGAVVSEAIPATVIARAAVPVSPEILAVDAVQAAPPAIPSYSSVSSGGGGGGGYFAPVPVTESGEASASASGGLFDNPMLLVGAAAAAMLVLSRK